MYKIDYSRLSTIVGISEVMIRILRLERLIIVLGDLLIWINIKFISLYYIT